MFSTPVMDASSGAATVSAISRGFAPGYVARTCTLGGTTSGYSLTGKSGIAINPTTKMMMDSTAAKIGLSTKKRAKFMMAGSPRSFARLGVLSACRRHFNVLGRHWHADRNLLDAVDDHAVAGI